MKTKQCSHMRRGAEAVGVRELGVRPDKAERLWDEVPRGTGEVASHLWLRAVQGTGCTDSLSEHRVEGTPGARPWGRRTLAAIAHSADRPRAPHPSVWGGSALPSKQ